MSQNRKKRNFLRKMRLRSHLAALVERLEERLPLTGPYTNVALNPAQVEALAEGSRGLSGMAERVDQSGHNAEPLGPIKNRDGTPVTPGLLGPFGQTTREAIENPIDDYFNVTPTDQLSTDSLIAHLGTDPAYLSIEGGLLDGTLDELVFDVHIQREYELSLLNIEFDSEDMPSPFFTKNGVEANLTALVDIQLVFGLTLDPSLNIEQAFFLRDYSLSTSIRVDTILHPFTINLGFLEASVPDVVLAGTLDILASQPSTTNSLRLTEINTLTAAELFSTTLGTNQFDATFNLDIAVGRWRLDGSTYLQTLGSWLGFEPALTFSPNFDEVFLFNNISSGELVAGLESFQAWLTSFSNFSQYDVDIPFTQSASTGSVYDIGEGMSGFTDNLRDDEGQPVFDNVQDFPYSGAGIDYDPVTDKLTLTIIQQLPEQQIQSRDTRVAVDDTLGLSSDTEATITGSGTLSFVVSIDLTRENLDFRDRISIDDLRIRTFYGSEAVVLTGNAAFGGLGLAFANAALSGQLSTVIDIGDAITQTRNFTLRALNDSISDLGSILLQPISWVGDMTLRVPNLSVMGNLFGLASDAFVELNVSDIASGIIETTTNASDLLNFEGVTFEGLADSLSEALLGTQTWDSEGDAVVATLGVSLDDFGPLKQDRIVDALTEAVEEADDAVGLARKIIQDIPAMVENLDVSSGASAVQFVSDLTYDTGSGLLSWLVDASAEETSSVGVGLGFQSLFNFTGDSNVSDTDNLVGEEATLNATSFSRLLLGLEFDPHSPGARSLPGGYLNSQSRLQRTLYVNANPADGSAVRVQGAAGSLGMTLRNGTVVIAQDLTNPDPASPAQFFSSIPPVVGRVRINDLPTYQPQRTTLGRLKADFQVVPDHTGSAEPNRLSFRVNNLNNPGNSTVLQSSPNFPSLKQGLDLTVDLNAFGPAMKEWFKQIADKVAQDVLGRAYPLVGDKLEQFTHFVEELRATIAPVLDALRSFSVSDVENAIEGAIRNLLGNPNGDYVHVDISTPTQFKLTLDIEGAAINTHQVVHTNLGMPALGADWQSDISVVGTYDFQVTFVLDVNEGFYVETDTEQIGMAIDIDMLGQATGKLGFFEIIATAQAPLPGQSAFHAEFNLDLASPSHDDKLFLRDIGTGPLLETNTSGLSGRADLQFTIEAAVNAWLPSIQTGLSVDWDFDGIGFAGLNAPEVTYDGIQLNLGRLLNEVFLPFFETIQDVFEPFTPIIELLTNPLPVLDDFTDPPVSLNGLAQKLARGLPEDSDIRRSIESLAQFIDTLATINRIVQDIHTDASSGLSLQLGSVTYGGSLSSQFDARQEQLDPSVMNQVNATSDLQSQFSGPTGAPNLAAQFDRSPGALHLPIIEDPLSAIGWILGVGEANLITWDLPDVSVSFPIDFTFPIFPGIVASMFGGLEIGTDLKVGLDTAGFSAYAKSRNLADLFQGFYVSDRANADGTGADVNELFIRGELFAGAGVGFEVLGVGVSLIVGGGVFTEVGLDLLDHDGDGKMRGSDLKSGDGCFAINGEMGVALEARAKAGIFKYELPITEATLLKGRQVISCPFYEPPPPTILAGLDPTTSTLTLFMGPEAHNRNVQPNVEEESFTVLQSGNSLIVSAFGKSQSFDANLVRNIVADGGTRDDRITFIGVEKPSILRGSEGDDVITGGNGRDFIDGAGGRDELHGGGDNDTLVGGLADDIIYGDDGDDQIFGQEGDDTLYGGADADHIETGVGRNTAYGDAGNDTILGGLQRDVLSGGEDDDTLEGSGGPDVLNGDAGIDTLRGQAGNDLLDGGTEGDFLYGDEGDDRLWGRAGVDELYGGVGLDYLNGGTDGDILQGQQDADELDGDEGDDTLSGGQGEDLIYGRGGFDTLRGGSERDTLYGGPDGDTIDGGDDNDEIFGEEGNDTLSGGAGDDVIEGGNDTDTIYGFEKDLLAASLPVGTSDRDTLHGGRGLDRIAGGPDDDLIFGDQDSDILLGNEGADTIQGNEGADVIYGFHLVTVWSPVDGGTDLPNQLLGNQGDDELHGGPVADLIRGHAGNDTIDGAAGPDTVYGDDGNDVIAGGSEVDLVDGGTGNDRIEGNEDADQLFGNRGFDAISGNAGDDFIAGNDQDDLVYGDEDDDLIYGGSGNDTLRGGNDDDTVHGQAGDDLIIGYQGIDFLYGDENDDVLYGGTQEDELFGGIGNDRLYGELGDDQLTGEEGDDVLEGGAGDDTLRGDAGNDALYGDEGQDTLSGGANDDFLFAGDGVSNLLNGDEGNDVLVGSDEGDEDPKFTDTTFFGDRLNGGDGDDVIDGLGGADIIDGGTGSNSIRGGTHIDSIVGGVDGTLTASFQLPVGPERRGVWSELSGSASQGGLTNIGGFEEAIYVDFSGVYVAWVDWRNGNSEIYVAHHPIGVGDWTPLVGFGVFTSASGGGISNDTNQSRRPTLFKTEDSDSLIVAWTSIAPDGSSTIEVAREDTGWTRIANPAQTGAEDDARFVQFADLSGLLFWTDNSTGVTRLGYSQYIHATGCFEGFSLAHGVEGLPPGQSVKSYDVAAVEFQAVVSIAYGSSSDQDIVVRMNGASLVSETQLCPAVPNASVLEYFADGWTTVHSVTAGDTQHPAVGIQYIEQRGFVKGEIELAVDVALAWEFSDQRQNQVAGLVIHVPLDGRPFVQPMIPEYRSDNGPRVSASSMSDTFGMAAKPDIAMSYGGTFLGWMDDGVLLGDNRSSYFVLSRARDTDPGDYVLREDEPHDASGQGISSTGGSMRELTLVANEDGFGGSFPFALWTEAATPALPVGSGSTAVNQNVYLRTTLPGLQAVDDVARLRKFGHYDGNVLDNDLNLFGEVAGFVNMFDGRELDSGEGTTVQFVSPLGARVTTSADGKVTYDPRGSAAFRALKAGETLSETFIYRVNNWIFQAEAEITFVVSGSNLWRNLRNALDVNDDGFVTALDALILINEINKGGSRALDDLGPAIREFLDVNDDNNISPIDALSVINWINSQR